MNHSQSIFSTPPSRLQHRGNVARLGDILSSSQRSFSDSQNETQSLSQRCYSSESALNSQFSQADERTQEKPIKLAKNTHKNNLSSSILLQDERDKSVNIQRQLGNDENERKWLRAAIEKIQSSVSNVQVMCRGMKEEIESTNKRITATESSISKIEYQLQELSGSVKTNQEQMTDINSRVEESIEKLSQEQKSQSLHLNETHKKIKLCEEHASNIKKIENLISNGKNQDNIEDIKESIYHLKVQLDNLTDSRKRKTFNIKNNSRNKAERVQKIFNNIQSQIENESLHQFSYNSPNQCDMELWNSQTENVCSIPVQESGSFDCFNRTTEAILAPSQSSLWLDE